MKKLILSVLCGIWAAAAFAQSASKQELAQWVQSKTWEHYKSVNKDGTGILLNGKGPTFRFSSTNVSFAQACNTCNKQLEFDAARQTIAFTDLHLGELCTSLHCGDEEERRPSEGFPPLLENKPRPTVPVREVYPCTIFGGNTLKYSREGDDLVIENDCGKIWLRAKS